MREEEDKIAYLNYRSIVVRSKNAEANDININKNSSFRLPNYNTEHQIRKSGRGRVCIFILSFFNLMYRYNMIPTINKLTKVGKIQLLLLTIS